MTPTTPRRIPCDLCVTATRPRHLFVMHLLTADAVEHGVLNLCPQCLARWDYYFNVGTIHPVGVAV